MTAANYQSRISMAVALGDYRLASAVAQEAMDNDQWRQDLPITSDSLCDAAISTSFDPDYDHKPLAELVQQYLDQLDKPQADADLALIVEGGTPEARLNLCDRINAYLISQGAPPSHIIVDKMLDDSGDRRANKVALSTLTEKREDWDPPTMGQIRAWAAVEVAGGPKVAYSFQSYATTQILRKKVDVFEDIRRRAEAPETDRDEPREVFRN